VGETKIKINVSMGGYDGRGRVFGYQPGQVVAVESGLAKKWVRSGLATGVNVDAPLSIDDGVTDLGIEEALRHRCVSCDERRAETVLDNKPYCQICYRGFVGK